MSLFRTQQTGTGVQLHVYDTGRGKEEATLMCELKDTPIHSHHFSAQTARVALCGPQNGETDTRQPVPPAQHHQVLLGPRTFRLFHTHTRKETLKHSVLLGLTCTGL